MEKVGLVKFDFLGLRTLTIIDWAVKAINARHARAGLPAVEITGCGWTTPASIARLRQWQCGHGFPVRIPGMRRTLKEAKPDRFEDLIALNALYRPGPMDLIPRSSSASTAASELEYPDQRIKVYSGDLRHHGLPGTGHADGSDRRRYSLGGADLLRRAMGKKVQAEYGQAPRDLPRGRRQGWRRRAQGRRVFDLMEKFAGYGFNKSHAAAYALVAYQTAWLKTHYPAEFMAAVLSATWTRPTRWSTCSARPGTGARSPAARNQRLELHVSGARCAHRTLRAWCDEGRWRRRQRGDRPALARGRSHSAFW